jgi:hypothetical protein
VDVEINLTSNDKILGVVGPRHPFPDYLRAGVPVTISTDDEGVSRTDLTNEYQLAVERYHLGYADLKGLVRNSLTFSFLRGASLWSSARPDRMVVECASTDVSAGVVSDRCENFLKRNERAREQWRLERDLALFERSASVKLRNFL